MASTNFRYSAGYVEGVRDVSVREFLVTVGLPARHVVFMACETSPEDAVLRIANREYLNIGLATEAGDIGAYHVDCDSGGVVLLDAQDSSKLHVNASPELFADCLMLFEAKIDNAAQSAHETDPEELAALLEAEILCIDPSTLADGTGFWRSLLDDVAIGDSTDEDGDS